MSEPTCFTTPARLRAWLRKHQASTAASKRLATLVEDSAAHRRLGATTKYKWLSRKRRAAPEFP
jgi:hypothetical protein